VRRDDEDFFKDWSPSFIPKPKKTVEFRRGGGKRNIEKKSKSLTSGTETAHLRGKRTQRKGEKNELPSTEGRKSLWVLDIRRREGAQGGGRGVVQQVVWEWGHPAEKIGCSTY